MFSNDWLSYQKLINQLICYLPLQVGTVDHKYRYISSAVTEVCKPLNNMPDGGIECHQSLSQLLHSAVLTQKQPETIPKGMNVALCSRVLRRPPRFQFSGVRPV